ncbi:hypothetical protein HK096_008540, partial [Nowakowskiella sp. JEL0078]
MNKQNFERFSFSLKPLMMKSLEVTSEYYDNMVYEMTLELPKYETFFNAYSVVILKETPEDSTKSLFANKFSGSFVDLNPKSRESNDLDFDINDSGSLVVINNAVKSNLTSKNTQIMEDDFETLLNVSPPPFYSTDNFQVENQFEVLSNSNMSLNSSDSSSQSNDSIDSAKVDEKIAANWKPRFPHFIRRDTRLDNKRRFHAVETSVYSLPADIEEQDRPGSTILDVGCGAGAWARDVAMMYPQATVYAVDMAKTLFEGIDTLPNIIFTTANVLEKLPFTDNYFDAVFQRFLTVGITKDKWDHVIKELLRVTKPCGFIELVEYEEAQNLGPTSQILIGGILDTLAVRGIDREIALNMKSRMEHAGLIIQSKTVCELP